MRSRYWPKPRLHAVILAAARRWADDSAAVAPGLAPEVALTARAFVALAQDEPDQAGRDAHDALEIAAQRDICVSLTPGMPRAPGGRRQQPSVCDVPPWCRRGHPDKYWEVRFPVYQAGCDATVATVRDALGPTDFEIAWIDGAALSTEEAIAYAQCGRGERKRPTSGWESLTPAELDVVRLASAGLGRYGSPQGFSSHHVPCRRISRTCTPSSG